MAGQVIHGRSAPRLDDTHLVGLSFALLLFIPTARVAFGLPGLVYIIPLVVLAGLTLRKLAAGRSAQPVMATAYAVAAVLLLSWLSVTALWTASAEQWMRDLVLIASLMFLVVNGLILSSPDTVRLTLAYAVLASVATTLWIVLQYVGVGTLRGYDLPLSESYLTVAQMVGIGAVGAMLAALVEKRRRRLWLAGGAISLVGLALALARGALLSTIGVIMLASGYLGVGVLERELARRRPGRVRRSALTKLMLLSFPVAFAMGTIIAALQVERTALMLRRFFSGGELARGGRGQIWASSWTSIGDSPVWGHGLGSSGLLSGQSDGSHAHNLVLQIWVDGGLVGLVALLFLLVVPFIVAFERRRRLGGRDDFVWLPILGVFVFMILEFSKSGNFYSARGFFLFGLFATFGSALPTREGHGIRSSQRVVSYRSSASQPAGRPGGAYPVRSRASGG